ncbi:MAG: acyl-CoA desaturase [Candidatus Poseidoniales archaeon]
MSHHPMKELRERLTTMGLMKKPTLKSWTKVITLLGIVLSLYFVHSQIPMYWGLLLIPITALFTTTLSMAGHEGVHASACNSRAGNISLAALVFPLFCGLSMEYWRDKHNIKHHAHPNVVHQDPDIHSWPLTFSQEEYQQSGKVRRFFQRNLQAYFFWPISLLVGHLMRWDGLKFLLTHPFKNKKKRFTKLWALDLGLMMAHFFLWLGLPILLGVPWQITIGFYILLWALVGTYLTAIFIVGHAGRPIVTEYDENWRLQIETGRRIKTNRLTSFFFVGLDYQIEHHLLPSVSHFNLPKVAPIVKKYAEERGWEYEEMGFFRALIYSTAFLHRAWRTPSIQIDSSTDEVIVLA